MRVFMYVRINTMYVCIILLCSYNYLYNNLPHDIDALHLTYHKVGQHLLTS